MIKNKDLVLPSRNRHFEWGQVDSETIRVQWWKLLICLIDLFCFFEQRLFVPKQKLKTRDLANLLLGLRNKNYSSLLIKILTSLIKVKSFKRLAHRNKIVCVC